MEIETAVCQRGKESRKEQCKGSKENRRLQKRIEDIRLVDRAKCLLIECCGMSEPEAHSYIEQQAMNRRCPKREVAQGIIDGETP